MAKPRKFQDEKDLEKLAKRLLSMPHKPREESKIGQRKVDNQHSTRQKNKSETVGENNLGRRKVKERR